MESEEPDSSLGGLGSDMYEVEDIETNVTDFIGSKIAETIGYPISVLENEVFQF